MASEVFSYEISRKPCSEYKMKEITGSGIFAANGENDTPESGSANPPPNKTGVRMYQVLLVFLLWSYEKADLFILY